MRNKLLQCLLEEIPQESLIFADKYADLVLRIDEILTQKGLSQRDLAKKLNKYPSEISKWLNGEANLTLKSIAKLEAELGETLLEVPRKSTQKQEQGYIRQEHTWVSYRKITTTTITDTDKLNWLQNVG
jgi:transcriptional regulator with XRE-family HTH domain